MGWIRAAVLWLVILEHGDSRGLSELGDSAELSELGDSEAGTVNPDQRAATMCECAHSFVKRFLISKRLRCTRHEDEMLWHKVERAVQCAGAEIDGQDKVDMFDLQKQTCCYSQKWPTQFPPNFSSKSFSTQFKFHSLML